MTPVETRHRAATSSIVSDWTVVPHTSHRPDAGTLFRVILNTRCVSIVISVRGVPAFAVLVGGASEVGLGRFRVNQPADTRRRSLRVSLFETVILPSAAISNFGGSRKSSGNCRMFTG